MWFLAKGELCSASFHVCLASKLERQACNFSVLLFGEFVLESCQEFWVDFEDEAFDILNHRLEVLVFVLGCFFHLFVPHVDFFDRFGGEDERGSCQLALVVLQERGIEESDLLDVLCKEENFVIASNQ